MLLTSDQSWNGLFPQPSTGDEASDSAYLHTGKTILVTGGGGSIGSALAKTIHRFRPRCLLLIDSSEQALYRIHSDLSQAASQCHVPILGSIADERCFRDACQRCRPEIIYHAAFKHVSLTEMKPFAVVQNNVLATSTLALLAQRFDVARLIMISTNKAVSPDSIMGLQALRRTRAVEHAGERGMHGFDSAGKRPRLRRQRGAFVPRADRTRPVL